MPPVSSWQILQIVGHTAHHQDSLVYPCPAGCLL